MIDGGFLGKPLVGVGQKDATFGNRESGTGEGCQ